MTTGTTTTGTTLGVLHGPGLTDVRMMTVAHSNFRRELRLSVPAIRAVGSGDTRRVGEIAEHVEMWLGFVHHHHSIEDDLLWDKLTERVPKELAPLVQLMESQHESVARLLDECPLFVAQWRETASIVDGARLADHLATLVDALCEHLDAEETHVLPLMARHIGQDEWNKFIEKGMESIPKKLLMTGFGMMLYEGDPEALALEIAKFPAPLRPLVPIVGRRAFRRYAKRIHGTATPARGTLSAERPATTTPRRRPPAVTTAAALQLLLGSVTSTAGTAFSIIAGGGWYVAAALFPVALVLWWTAGIGLLRGSRRRHRLGVGMLLALSAFNLMKIVVFHEGAGYVFMCVTLLVLAIQLSPSTRAWARR